MPALLDELGVPAAPLLAECGLPPDAFDDDEHWLHFGDASRLLGLAAERSGRDDFGLLVARRCEPAALGELAQRMMLAPDVGAALQVLRRDFHLHDRGAVPYLSRLDASRVALGYALSRHHAPGMDVAYDIAMGIALSLLKALCGEAFVPDGVSLAHRAPRNAGPFRRYFGAPVQFEAPHTQIEFRAAWLRRPVAAAPAAQRAHLQHAARAFEADVPRSAGERARSVAQALLMTGGLSETRIATELGLHARTLRRRLDAEGLGAQALMSDVRDQFAQQLLAVTRLPLADIAAAAQYADVASFARAFKRRVGMPPGRWRALQLEPPAGR